MNLYLIVISFILGNLLLEIPSIIKQIYIEKTISKRALEYACSKNTMTRRYCAFYGYYLDKLKNDKKWNVRLEVCRKGYYLEEFLNDSNYLVRKQALRQINLKK